MTCGQKFPKLNSRMVYCSRLYSNEHHFLAFSHICKFLVTYNLAQENERYEIKTVGFKAGCVVKLANKQNWHEIIRILRLNWTFRKVDKNIISLIHFFASLYCITYYFGSYEDPSFKGLLWATAKYHAFDICWHIKFRQFCTLIFSI